MLGNTVGQSLARGLGNQGRHDRLLGGKYTLFIPTHDAMGREKRTTQPTLGVREGFLEEMVLKLVSKNIWQFERRKRFQGEGTA